MSAFGRMKKTPEAIAVTPAAEPGPLDAIEAALAAVASERADAMAWLAGFADRERAMLDRGASDAELGAHAAERRGQGRSLARAEARGRQLAAQAAELREAARQAQWAALRDEYIAQATLLAEKVRAMQAQHELVMGLCATAERLNFTALGMSMLPRPPHIFEPDAGARIEDQLRDLSIRSPGQAAQGPKLYPVRMLRGWNNLNRNEMCGFPGTTAHRLVDAGFAAWATDEIPPAPPSPAESTQRVRMRPIG